jgi:hypothetical protein
MKRVHGYPKDLAKLEYFGANHNIEYPSVAFQDYYPRRFRFAMMRNALTKLNLDPSRKLRLENLIRDTSITMKQKFDKFVSMMTQQELNCIGW